MNYSMNDFYHGKSKMNDSSGFGPSSTFRGSSKLKQ